METVVSSHSFGLGLPRACYYTRASVNSSDGIVFKRHLHLRVLRYVCCVRTAARACVALVRDTREISTSTVIRSSPFD